MSISDMTVSKAAFKARLQGVEEVTLGKQHTSTRTTESGSAILAVSDDRARFPTIITCDGMLKLIVEEAKVSISEMATTWTPFKHACKAQKGSRSAIRAADPVSETSNLICALLGRTEPTRNFNRILL